MVGGAVRGPRRGRPRPGRDHDRVALPRTSATTSPCGPCRWFGGRSETTWRTCQRKGTVAAPATRLTETSRPRGVRLTSTAERKTHAELVPDESWTSSASSAAGEKSRLEQLEGRASTVRRYPADGSCRTGGLWREGERGRLAIRPSGTENEERHDSDKRPSAARLRDAFPVFNSGRPQLRDPSWSRSRGSRFWTDEGRSSPTSRQDDQHKHRHQHTKVGPRSRPAKCSDDRPRPRQRQAGRAGRRLAALAPANRHGFSTSVQRPPRTRPEGGCTPSAHGPTYRVPHGGTSRGDPMTGDRDGGQRAGMPGVGHSGVPQYRSPSKP